jgi:hypothetical protein
MLWKNTWATDEQSEQLKTLHTVLNTEQIMEYQQGSEINGADMQARWLIQEVHTDIWWRDHFKIRYMEKQTEMGHENFKLSGDGYDHVQWWALVLADLNHLV